MLVHKVPVQGNTTFCIWMCRKGLTWKYYAKKILYFLRQQNILKNLKEYLQRPAEQQSFLEGKSLPPVPHRALNSFPLLLFCWERGFSAYISLRDKSELRLGFWGVDGSVVAWWEGSCTLMRKGREKGKEEGKKKGKEKGKEQGKAALQLEPWFVGLCSASLSVEKTIFGRRWNMSLSEEQALALHVTSEHHSRVAVAPNVVLGGGGTAWGRDRARARRRSQRWPFWEGS